MRPPEQIKTSRLILRVPLIEDAEAIFRSYAQDPEVTSYLTWRLHSSIEVTKCFLEGCLCAWQEGKRFPYVITQVGSEQAIGMIELRLNGHKADVGYGLAREYWGKGYTTEALQALIVWCFEQPEIYRIWAVCDVENAASARVMEKAGMQREGRLRREIIHPNISEEPRDCYLYSIVK